MRFKERTAAFIARRSGSCKLGSRTPFTDDRLGVLSIDASKIGLALHHGCAESLKPFEVGRHSPSSIEESRFNQEAFFRRCDALGGGCDRASLASSSQRLFCQSCWAHHHLDSSEERWEDDPQDRNLARLVSDDVAFLRCYPDTFRRIPGNAGNVKRFLDTFNTGNSV